MKREFFSTYLPDILKYQNSVGGAFFHADRRPGGRTVGHDEANTRFSQFCERAWKTCARWGLVGPTSKYYICIPCVKAQGSEASVTVKVCDKEAARSSVKSVHFT